MTISSADPFSLILEDQPPYSWELTPPWNATGGLTQVPAVLDPTKRNAVLVYLGQSQSCNVSSTMYVPTYATKIINFNIYDGAAYLAASSLLGCTNYTPYQAYGNISLRLADLLINANLFDVVWLLPIGIGGTSVAEWDTGPCSDRLCVLVKRLAARGIPASAITAVLWQQGPTDTLLGTTQSAYQASLLSIIAKSRTLGVSAPWFVAQESFAGAGSPSSAAVLAAQAAVVSAGAGIFAGPNTDLVPAADRWDGLHFGGTGQALVASAWLNSLQAFGAPF